MSEFEMDAMDLKVEAVANSNHKNERPAAGSGTQTGTVTPAKSFWNQVDDEIHYKRFRRQQIILSVLKIVVCILAAAALVCAMYIPEALPYIVNIGVAAFIVAGAIILDRLITRWRV